MRTRFSVAVLLLVLVACKKEVDPAPQPTSPEMRVTSFNNITAGRQEPRQFDVDGDGIRDITFGFLLVGDPLAQADKHQFYVSGSFDTFFPVNPAEEMPLLQEGQEIAPGSFAGYNWYNAPAILLAQKTLTVSNPPYWTGAWKNASHKYFPFYLLKGDKKYFGWFEISFDTTIEKTILHRAAVSKLADKAVKAGGI